jgi:hypothetical protein
MNLKKMFAPVFSCLCGAMLLAATFAAAQDPTTSQEQQPKEQDKTKAEMEKKAFNLLEQVISESAGLKLPENRIRVQFTAGDLIWERDEARARALFSSAAASLAEMIRAIDSNDRQYFNLIQAPTQLRQEMLPLVARRDANLAYEFLNATKLPPSPEVERGRPGGEPGGPFGQIIGSRQESNLEANILAQVAASDPKLALQNARQLLDSDQYPNSLSKVLSQLQAKDKDAATKLTDEILRKLRGESLTTKADARSLAFALLQPGPRPAETTSSKQETQPAAPAPTQPMDESSYKRLMESVISAALNVTPSTQDLRRGAIQRAVQGAPPGGGGRGAQVGGQGGGRAGQGGGRGGGQGGGQVTLPGGGLGGGGRGAQGAAQGSNQGGGPNQQNDQINGMALLMGMQSLLPQIEQYLPSRAGEVRQKLSQLGGNLANLATRAAGPFGEFTSIVQQGSSETILQAAAQADPNLQPRLYQQAAIKAINEGNPERAAQIASDKLSPEQQRNIQQQIERQKMMTAAIAGKAEEMRQLMSRARTNEEKVSLLAQLATAAGQQGNKKLAAQLLEEARGLTAARAENYQQLEAPLRIARAYAGIDPKLGFEVLEPGISLINELLPAAMLLNGFEVRLFKDGELPIQGGAQLSSVIARYSQELATLARIDFEGAQVVADKFQRAEPRIMARLAIVRGVLIGPENPNNAGPGRGFGPGRANGPGR